MPSSGIGADLLRAAVRLVRRHVHAGADHRERVLDASAVCLRSNEVTMIELQA